MDLVPVAFLPFRSCSIAPRITFKSLSSIALRVHLVATLVLACGPAIAAPIAPPAAIARPVPAVRPAPVAQPARPTTTARPTPAARPAPRTPPVPPMAFYVAKGAAHSCGRGCDSWIAAEGQVDSGAAARFREVF